MWSNMPPDQRITLKVADYGGVELKNFIKGKGIYNKGTLDFTTGPNNNSVKVIFSRFHPQWSGNIYVDRFKLYKL